MTKRNSFISAVCVSAPILITVALSSIAQPPAVINIPVSGKSGPGLEPLDQAVLRVMDRHGVPGAALAVARKGKLVLAKGYGWGNIEANEPVRPDTVFGLASLSKPITAAAVLKLVEQGKLKLDDRAFDHLALRPLPGARVDPRIRTITIRQLLNHSGGWDRQKTGDPANWSRRVSLALGTRPPVTADQLITYMLGQPLDFDPGTQQLYSNMGYIILGQVVSAVSGQPYEQFVREQVLNPVGATRCALHTNFSGYRPGEAHCYLAGTINVLPPLTDPMIVAAGGWYGSVLDVVRLLTALDGSRGKPLLSDESLRQMLAPPTKPLEKRPDGGYVGLGWDTVMPKDGSFGYFKDGSWHGMRTYLKRKPEGVNWVLLFNASMNFDAVDAKLTAEALREIHETVDGAHLPEVDLFGEFR